jgi:hypothetical protein
MSHKCAYDLKCVRASERRCEDNSVSCAQIDTLDLRHDEAWQLLPRLNTRSKVKLNNVLTCKHRVHKDALNAP